jgi:hypothetical protein
LTAGRPNKGLQKDRYSYRVTWSEKDREYVGLCAEFPRLSWLALSPEAALRGMRTVVAEVSADLAADGEPVPEPIATKQYSGQFLVRVPPELHRRFAFAAAEAGVSLNRMASEKLGHSRASRTRPHHPLPRMGGEQGGPHVDGLVEWLGWFRPPAAELCR